MHRPLPEDLPPVWVVWPGAAAEVSNVLRIAGRHGLAVVTYGAGSSLSGLADLSDPRRTVVLDTKRMRQVLDVDESSLVIHAQAGITGRELEERLLRHRLRLGHLPSSLYFSTLGGWLATRSAGELTSRYGRVEDICLGLTAVLADGRIIHTRPVPRKATGPDLMRLLLGSEGTLGVITAAHLRVHRLHEVRLRLSALFDRPEDGLESLGEAIARGVRPGMAVLLDPLTGSRLHSSTGWLMCVSFEGAEPVVSAELDLTAELATARGGELLGPKPAAEWWATRHREPHRILSLRASGETLVDEMDLAAPWSRLVSVAYGVRRALERAGAEARVELGHFTLEGGCAVVRFQAQLEKTRDASERLRMHDDLWRVGVEACRKAGGGLVHHRGVGRQRLEFADEELGSAKQLLARVKDALDPKRTLNPGLLNL
jgi:alkyldihydroxyacetonephosphate synthase